MRLQDLDYDLPPERIAQVPVEPRDSARLLVDRGGAPPAHRHVRDLPSLLRPGDVLVVNETRVLASRLRLHRATGGAAEVLLLEPHRPGGLMWEALVRPARRLRNGEWLLDGDGRRTVQVLDRSPAGDTFRVLLRAAGVIEAEGELPLPPYLHAQLADPERYQTVYATVPGSAAAPTAGLHLTTQLLEEIEAVGVTVGAVELVVGLDTFQPVSEPDPLDHRMHSERYRVPEGLWKACADAERVVAVGTTSTRALESVAATGQLEGRTELFLHRGAGPQIVDVLMTNFHLPRTTLLLMIEAFVGPRWRTLYATALAEGYRFLTFGDATLLDRHA
ncbi:MAG: S-adenosylmethionine:tRNA ribosyltransferase-isomerase [Ilumatobacteraceae bacterium]